MNVRIPIRAGSFYEASSTSCLHHARKLIAAAKFSADLPKVLYGGIVPHAGWMYSGELAVATFKALVSQQPDTIVLFGADHCGTVAKGEIYDSGTWRSPIGEVKIDDELASVMIKSSPKIRSNAQAHAYEHSLEVQIPFIQILYPQAKILPIGVPSNENAVEIGIIAAKTAGDTDKKVIFIGSSDLTHHGGHFPAPGGEGEAGVEWSAKNDQRMIDLLEAMDAHAIVPEASAHENACGAGALAATVAACKIAGATKGRCISYTNSYEVVHAIYPNDPDDTSVGYASVVFE